VHAYLVYVRPLLEYNLVVWSPDTVKDIAAIESVQRRFIKRLPGLRDYSYQDRLHCLKLQSLEQRRLCGAIYKILFGIVDVQLGKFLIIMVI